MDGPEALLQLSLGPPDPWTIKKKITNTDADMNQGRLLLKKELAETHIVRLWRADAERIGNIYNGNGVDVAVWDIDTRSEYQLKFKQWPSTESYVFIGNWTRDFLIRRGLGKDDEIGLLWLPSESRFNFSLLKKA